MLRVLSCEDRAPRVFQKKEVIIGRAAHCDLRLENGVDDVHCMVAVTRQGYVVEDLASTVGTVFQGRKITRVFVEPGDRFGVGPHTVQLLPP